MKLIIAGSRTITLQPSTLLGYVKDKMGEGYDVLEEIVSGTAGGIDQSGEVFAIKYNIPIKKFPADWGKYGKRAGPIRNREMAEYADTLLLIWDGKSKGSASMKAEMKRLNKTVHEVILQPIGAIFDIEREPRRWRNTRETGTREITLDFNTDFDDD